MSILSQIAATLNHVSCWVLNAGHDHQVIKRDGEFYQSCICGHRTKGFVVSEWQYNQARRAADEQIAKHDGHSRWTAGDWAIVRAARRALLEID